jgi:hypothetical protein
MFLRVERKINRHHILWLGFADFFDVYFFPMLAAGVKNF